MVLQLAQGVLDDLRAIADAGEQLELFIHRLGRGSTILEVVVAGAGMLVATAAFAASLASYLKEGQGQAAQPTIQIVNDFSGSTVTYLTSGHKPIVVKISDLPTPQPRRRNEPDRPKPIVGSSASIDDVSEERKHRALSGQSIFPWHSTARLSLIGKNGKTLRAVTSGEVHELVAQALSGSFGDISNLRLTIDHASLVLSGDEIVTASTLPSRPKAISHTRISG